MRVVLVQEFILGEFSHLYFVFCGPNQLVSWRTRCVSPSHGLISHRHNFTRTTITTIYQEKAGHKSRGFWRWRKESLFVSIFPAYDTLFQNGPAGFASPHNCSNHLPYIKDNGTSQGTSRQHLANNVSLHIMHRRDRQRRMLWRLVYSSNAQF